MIEPPAVDEEEATATIYEEAALQGNPFLLWQLLFPEATSYEGDRLSTDLNERLAQTSGPASNRVKVVGGTRGLYESDLRGFSGLVILKSTGSRRRLHKAGFQYLCRYVALPGIENPRWLLPLEDASNAAVFTLPRMYRLSSRLLRLGVIFGLKPGTFFWKARTITVATREKPALISTLTAIFPGHKIRLSFAAGTPGPMRKPTVVCMDANGTALAYAKVAVSPVSKALVRNEARILGLISATPRLLRLAPRLLVEAECGGRLVVAASAVGGSGISSRYGGLQQRFFEALKSGEMEPVSESPFLARLARSLDGRGESQLERLLHDARGVLANVELPRTLMHGDAAPWNMRKIQGSIVAFDWEYGVPDGLPVLDEVHYHWHVGLLLGKHRVSRLISRLDAVARSRSRLDQRQAAALVDIYLVHGLIHRLGMGCGEDDELVAAFREALSLRTASTEAHG